MDSESLRERALAIHLNGVLAHWSEAQTGTWLPTLMKWEEDERTRRSLVRRVKEAHLGRFKPLVDFEWSWPKRCDRGQIEGLMELDFLDQASNVILVGPNGVGKTTLAKNVAYQALKKGRRLRFTTAGELLGDLAALDSDTALRRRLRYYASPDLLVIDEIGYLSYSNRHADLLFEWVTRRYETKSTIVTINKAFSAWIEVLPNASCVSSLIDRLVHHSEVVAIDGESYRGKEAKERAEQRHSKTRKVKS